VHVDFPLEKFSVCHLASGFWKQKSRYGVLQRCGLNNFGAAYFPIPQPPPPFSSPSEVGP
jgi:hypothetical protein